jgi:AAA domain, putative AbiEii toxin, Type IV TA system
VTRQPEGSFPENGLFVTHQFWVDFIGKKQASIFAPYRLPTVRGAVVHTKAIDATPFLSADGSNLSDVCLWLLTRAIEQWRSICAAVYQIVPSIGELIVDVKGNEVALVVRGNYGGAIERNIKDIGTGVEQLLLVAVACESQRDPRMVVVDEPEIGLHPASQRVLLGHLRRWAESRQIVVVTHSPTLVEPSDGHPSERTYVVRRNPANETSTVEEVTGSRLWRGLEELGVPANDVFGATRVVVVEGPSDAECMKIWFPELKSNPWCKVIDLGGSAKIVVGVDVLEKLHSFDPRKVLALLDADEGGVPGSETVRVLKRRELENYFLDQTDALISVLVGVGGASELDVSVSVAVEEIVESFKDEVLRLRVQRKIDPHLLSEKRRFLRLQNEADDKDLIGVERFQSLVERAISKYPKSEEIKTA